jgi:hypothetical protein
VATIRKNPKKVAKWWQILTETYGRSGKEILNLKLDRGNTGKLKEENFDSSGITSISKK